MVASDSNNAKIVDGRRARSARTRQLVVDAYLGLLPEKRGIPTSEQIAVRAGLSSRAVFAHFSDCEALATAAFDHVLSQSPLTPAGDKLKADRPTRIRFQVETRARTCEMWLPFWKVAVAGIDRSHQIASRIDAVRARFRGRLESIYQAELASLAEPQRIATLVALDELTSFEGWERVRRHYGLSYGGACKSWIYAIDRLLPPTPAALSQISSTRRRRRIDSSRPE